MARAVARRLGRRLGTVDRREVARYAMKVAQRSMAESLYLRTGINVTQPTSIKGMINERCNSRCRYCAYWRIDELRESGYLEEISIDVWKRAMLSLKEVAGPFTIQFSGGEPFIKPGFLDLLEHCCANDISWGVITNGLCLGSKRSVDRAVAARPFNFDISVDSPDADIHNYVRGIPRNLQKVEKAIGLLNEARDRMGISFPIRIKATVTKVSFRSLPGLVDWTKRVGGDVVDISPVRPWTEESNSDLWIEDEKDRQELAEIGEILIQQKKDGAPIETTEAKLESMPTHFLKDPIRHGMSPCRVGLREYHIRSNGDVEVCWWHRPLGNVKNQTAHDIWYGEVAQRIRAETVACTKFGTVACANSCLTARSMTQEVRRGLTVLRSTGLKALRGLVHAGAPVVGLRTPQRREERAPIGLRHAPTVLAVARGALGRIDCRAAVGVETLIGFRQPRVAAAGYCPVARWRSLRQPEAVSDE